MRCSIFITFLLFNIFLGVSCTTSAPPSPDDEIGDADLLNGSNKHSSSSKGPSKPIETATSPQKTETKVSEEELCQSYLKRARTHIAPLFVKANISLRDELLPILNSPDKDCSDSSFRKQVLIGGDYLFNRIGKKIAVILPLTGSLSKKGTSYWQALQKGFSLKNKVKISDYLTIFDSQSKVATLESIYAQIINNGEYRLVIGGISQTESQKIAYLSQLFLMPHFSLSPHNEIVAQYRYSFKVFPEEKLMADALALAAAKRSRKNIALLTPEGSPPTFLQNLNESLKNNNIEIKYSLSFNKKDLSTIELALKNLLQLDEKQRKEEYDELVKQQQEKAKKAKAKFDPRSVILKPIVDFDAIFILDDFRTVRYVCKLLKYLGTGKLPMYGTYMWRSAELLEPYESMLDGSIFVDVMGDYTQAPITYLPSAKDIKLVTPPYLVDSNSTDILDYEIVGFRAGELALMVARLQEQKRFPLFRSIKNLPQDPKDLYFKTRWSSKVFNEQRVNYWPTFIYQVKGRQLSLVDKF